MTNNKKSAHLNGWLDGRYEHPPANIKNESKEVQEEYIAGYEEGRIETSEKWKYVDTKND